MFTKSQEQENIEDLSGKAVAQSQENKLVHALDSYVQSIKVNENQPQWVYSNAITLSAQINRFDLGLKLQPKAMAIYPQSEEINRAIALLYERQNRSEKAIEFYQRCLTLNAQQPEWVYTKLLNLLIKVDLLGKAEAVKQQGLKYFPQSAVLTKTIINKDFDSNTATAKTISIVAKPRTTPANIERSVDLNIAQVRREIMDSAIVQQYEILLEQLLCNVESGNKEMNPDALIHCLAEIKTDIHYLKTKLFEPSVEIVDPQAKQQVDLATITKNNSQPIPFKCHLSNRIVGNGWHAPESHGRWTGSGTLSSIVLPYPRQGKYRLEIVVKAEAKSGLLASLKVSLNNRPIAIQSEPYSNTFPTTVNAEVEIETQPQQSFLGIDLAIAETVKPQAQDSRLIGLLIESINLIPVQP